jgi:hypothetical protein
MTPLAVEVTDRLIREFLARSAALDGLPADRLLEAVYLATSGAFQENDLSWPRLLDAFVASAEFGVLS